MKKIIALLTLLPATAMAHTSAKHTDAHVSSFHFLTEPDHLAMIALGIIAVAFAAEKIVTRFYKK